MPALAGKANVDGKEGRLAIDVELNHVDRPARLGPSTLLMCCEPSRRKGKP